MVASFVEHGLHFNVLGRRKAGVCHGAEICPIVGSVARIDAASRYSGAEPFAQAGRERKEDCFSLSSCRGIARVDGGPRKHRKGTRRAVPAAKGHPWGMLKLPDRLQRDVE